MRARPRAAYSDSRRRLTPPFQLWAARSHLHRRRSPELPLRCWTPLTEAACAASPSIDVLVEPHRPLLAQRHPGPHWCSRGTPCRRVIVTGPPVSAPSRARTARVTRADTRVVSPLDRAARSRPSQPFGRWHVAGRHDRWTVVVGRMRSLALCGRFNCFWIYLSPKNSSNFQNL
jgi:hypothetical protein